MKSSSSTGIRDLLREYLAVVASELESRQPSAPTMWAGEQTFSLEPPRPTRFAILERMIDALGPRFEIPDARQLEALIIERFAERLRPGAPVAFDDEALDALDALVSAIQAPLREYRFCIGYSGSGQMAYNVDFCGSPLVRLAAVPVEDRAGMWSHHIEGLVQACAYEDAAERAETVLEEFLGACMTVGMTTTVRLPRTVAPASQQTIGIEPGPPEGPLYLDVGLSALFGTTVFQIPPYLSDIEELALQRGAVAEATSRIVATLTSLFSQGGDGALAVRTALRFFCRGVAAREYGLAVFNWFTALEGLLLDPESRSDVQARLIEAVAFSLGAGVSDRVALRKDLKQLYDDRSRFAHAGRATERPGVRAKCEELTRRVLWRELQCL